MTPPVDKPPISADADGRVLLQGPLTFATVGARLKASAGLFRSHKQLCFDLQAVTSVDSAALALVVEWLRLGECHAVAVRFEHVPDALRSLAEVSELEQIESALAAS
ncbi:lipid asymmetry maintenance protein MlaB [Immundisolibacter sp.]|uniref:STAS domain-containing protein n=1 Tax=Immundisolibacter sp. TaxID=1934948 RepID=UPI000ED6F397|nr:hypothetical protein [Gammaproteobacteria bacterium]